MAWTLEIETKRISTSYIIKIKENRKRGKENHLLHGFNYHWNLKYLAYKKEILKARAFRTSLT